MKQIALYVIMLIGSFSVNFLPGVSDYVNTILFKRSIIAGYCCVVVIIDVLEYTLVYFHRFSQSRSIITDN